MKAIKYKETTLSGFLNILKPILKCSLEPLLLNLDTSKWSALPSEVSICIAKCSLGYI